MIDRTIKSYRREAHRRKRRPVHGRGLEHVLNAIGRRARKLRKPRQCSQCGTNPADVGEWCWTCTDLADQARQVV